MENNKTAIIGDAGAGVIGARALLEQIMHERENPPLLIIPNLNDLDEKTIKNMIEEARLSPPLIVAGIDDTPI